MALVVLVVQERGRLHRAGELMARRRGLGLEAGLNPGVIAGEGIGEAAEMFARTNAARDEYGLRRGGQQFYQEQQRGEATRAEKRFDMAAQLHPYQLQHAQQQVDTERLRYTEAERKARDDAEAAALTQDFVNLCLGGKCSSEDIILKGLNIGAKKRDANAVAGAMKDLKDAATDREFGTAQDALITASKGLMGKALRSGKYEDWEALETEILKPDYVKARKSSWAQGALKQAEATRAKVMTDPAREAISKFRALALGGTRPADQVWNQVLTESEDAAAYFAENPGRVPPEIKTALDTGKAVETRKLRLGEIAATWEEARKTERVKGEEARKTEGAKQVGRRDLARAKSDTDLKAAATIAQRQLSDLQKRKMYGDEDDFDEYQGKIADAKAVVDEYTTELARRGRAGGGAAPAAGGLHLLERSDDVARPAGARPKGVRPQILIQARSKLNAAKRLEDVDRWLAHPQHRALLSDEEIQHLRTQYAAKFKKVGAGAK